MVCFEYGVFYVSLPVDRDTLSDLDRSRGGRFVFVDRVNDLLGIFFSVNNAR